MDEMEVQNNVQVEEAPEDIDLDKLLGLEDVEMDNKSKKGKITFDNSVSDDVKVEEPHIKVPTKELIEVLNISSQISSAGENSFEGKVVCMKVEDGKVRFLLSDNKRNIEKDVELLNKENQFEGFVAFGSSSLNRISKVCTSIFTLIQRNGEDDKKKYFIVVKGGEVAVDNINMEESKFVKDFQCDNDTDYEEDEIVSAVKRLDTFASTSIRSGKSIDFLGNVIEASPINGLAKYHTKQEYPTFKLSLVDSKILHNLCSFDDASTLKISKDGKIFIGGDFKFKTESYPAKNSIVDTVASRMFEGESALIDANHLKQLTNLSCALDTSTGNLKFNYTEDGFVGCQLLTKRENSNLVVQGNANTSLVKMDNDIEISSFNLKAALTVFPSEDTLNMRVTPDGICFENENIQVSVLGKSAGK